MRTPYSQDVLAVPGDAQQSFGEQFEARPGTFRIGIKVLNTKSVKAAHRDPNKIVLVAARHLTREIRAEADMESGRIKPHLTPNNYVLVGATRASGIEATFNNLLTAAKVRKPLRVDCIMAIELVFSLPKRSGVDSRAYFNDCLTWAQIEFEPGVVFSAIVHLDEACPHMHVLIAPIVNGHMQGGKLAGYRAAFNRRANHFHATVAKRYGLARPKEKLQLGAEQRTTYASKLIDVIVNNPLLINEDTAVRKALTKLIATDPVILGIVLNLPPPDGNSTAQKCPLGDDAGDLPSEIGATTY